MSCANYIVRSDNSVRLEEKGGKGDLFLTDAEASNESLTLLSSGDN